MFSEEAFSEEMSSEESSATLLTPSLFTTKMILSVTLPHSPLLLSCPPQNADSLGRHRLYILYTKQLRKDLQQRKSFQCLLKKYCVHFNDHPNRYSSSSLYTN